MSSEASLSPWERVSEGNIRVWWSFCSTFMFPLLFNDITRGTLWWLNRHHPRNSGLLAETDCCRREHHRP